MIVARRPCTLYDVDAIGLAAITVMLAAGWFGVLQPASAGAETTDMAVRRLEQERSRLKECETRLVKTRDTNRALQDGIQRRLADTPQSAQLPELLRTVARLARDNGLDLQELAPGPAQHADGYSYCDVRFRARGRGTDFARFLGRLASGNPYHALLECHVQYVHPAPTESGALRWTLRFYLIDPADTDARLELEES